METVIFRNCKNNGKLLPTKSAQMATGMGIAPKTG
jgi:hypothetical protein